MSAFIKSAKLVFCGAIGISVVTSRVVAPCSVSGDSMLPTIASRSLVLVDKLTPPTKLKKDDVVLCHDPEEYGKYIVKRVAALPGQFVDLDPDMEPGEYVAKHAFEGKMSVPSGHCWLEGDNKGKSHDSRAFGPVPLGLIQGRALFQVAPWPKNLLT